MGFIRMMSQAMRMVYDGPMEALFASFLEAYDYSLLFVDLKMIVSVLIGAVLCAWVTENFAKRYP
jgi:hypothetical protein